MASVAQEKRATSCGSVGRAVALYKGRPRFLIQPVWPDNGIKSSPIAQNVGASVFSLIGNFFKIAKKTTRKIVLHLSENLSPRPFKFVQSGQTGSNQIL